jgi:hypothetical protein
MKAKLILISLCMMASIASFGQEPTDSLPPHDFIVFFLSQQSPFWGLVDNDKQLFQNGDEIYMGEINYWGLLKEMRVGRSMSRIPPIKAIFYNKGYQSEIAMIPSITFFLTTSKAVEKKTETFTNLGDYETRREELSEKDGIYIIEEESIGYNHYLYVVLSGEDRKGEGRFYNKLSDMQQTLYKGEFADYYYQNFERSFEYYSSNNETLYKLKLYFYDFPNTLPFDKTFTNKDCKRIFGREMLIKSYTFRNETYVLTWYEY